MKVNLRSVAEAVPGVAEEHLYPVRRLRTLAEQDRFGQYALTDDPDAVDLIIFVESHGWDSPAGRYYQAIRRDPIYRRHRGKAFVHSGRDWPVPLVRGVFASIERGWCWKSRARSGSYLAEPHPFVEEAAQRRGAGEIEAATPRYLASFVGSVSDTPVRRALLGLNDGEFLLADNTQRFLGAIRSGDHATVQQLKQDYAQTALASRFILCPRGYGASSFRLFEAMQLGRAPVILSDAWVPPDGPDWSACSLRISERGVANLPAILRQHADQWASLGQRARAAWEEWFGPRVLFHRICQSCQSIRDQPLPEWSTRWLCYAHFARPLHAKPLARKILKRERR